MKRWRVFCRAWVCAGVLASSAGAALFDHSNYDAVLKRYVNEDGLVDYSSIRDNSLSALESYFQLLGDADLAGWSYKERLAFWINAYNARVIYLVAQRPELKKISDDFEMFNQSFKTAGVMLSPNDIKHRILRGTKNPDNEKGPLAGLTLEKRDPRIHFSLVSGTLGCPKLRPFAYTAENVEETLYGNAKRFANASNYVDVAHDKLQLSTLLKWYAKDFDAFGGVAAYLTQKISSEKRGDANDIQVLLANDFKKAEYRYDWTVNDQKTSPAQSQRLMPDPQNIPADALSTSGPAR